MTEDEIRADERKKACRAIAKLWRNRECDKSLHYSELFTLVEKLGGNPKTLGEEP